jgi:hypothetical protein
MHARDDVLVIERQPVAAGKADFHMRAIGLGNVESQQPVELQGPLQILGAISTTVDVTRMSIVGTLSRRARCVLNKSDTLRASRLPDHHLVLRLEAQEPVRSAFAWMAAWQYSASPGSPNDSS